MKRTITFTLLLAIAYDKIVKEAGYWDISKLMLDMQSLQDSTKNK